MIEFSDSEGARLLENDRNASVRAELSHAPTRHEDEAVVPAVLAIIQELGAR